jgi:hypothetical protein
MFKLRALSRPNEQEALAFLERGEPHGVQLLFGDLGANLREKASRED